METVGKLIQRGVLLEQVANRYLNAEPVLNKDWKQDRMRAVGFLQERASRRILGAATVALSELRKNQD